MSYDSPYDVLVPWCAEHLELTEQEQWDLLHNKNITIVQSTPISLRTLMASLTPEEYVTAKTILTTAAASNVLIADAVAIMSNVGPWTESGLDIGADAARALVDALFTGDYALLGEKIKSLAEVQKSQLEIWGLRIERGNLISAIELAQPEPAPEPEPDPVPEE